MPVAVFDTYVKKSNGDTLHFDIIVPEGEYNEREVIAFGKAHLESIGESQAVISAKECQFCHVENPSEEVLESIDKQGYYILDLGVIPGKLPESPTRRDMILYIRATSEEHRFENFRNKSIDDLKAIIGAAS